MVFCSECGVQGREGAKFCCACGTSLNSVHTIRPSGSPKMTRTKPSNGTWSPKNGRKATTSTPSEPTNSPTPVPTATATATATATPTRSELTIPKPTRAVPSEPTPTERTLPQVPPTRRAPAHTESSLEAVRSVTHFHQRRLPEVAMPARSLSSSQLDVSSVAVAHQEPRGRAGERDPKRASKSLSPCARDDPSPSTTTSSASLSSSLSSFPASQRSHSPPSQRRVSKMGGKTGWVLKQHKGIRTSWKARWFVAYQGMLYYYKQPNDIKLRLSVSLSSCAVEPMSANRPFCFHVFCAEKNKHWFLQASSESDRKAWIHTMIANGAKELNPTNNLPSPTPTSTAVPNAGAVNSRSLSPTPPLGSPTTPLSPSPSPRENTMSPGVNHRAPAVHSPPPPRASPTSPMQARTQSPQTGLIPIVSITPENNELERNTSQVKLTSQPNPITAKRRPKVDSIEFRVPGSAPRLDVPVSASAPRVSPSRAPTINISRETSPRTSDYSTDSFSPVSSASASPRSSDYSSDDVSVVIPRMQQPQVVVPHVIPKIPPNVHPPPAQYRQVQAAFHATGVQASKQRVCLTCQHVWSLDVKFCRRCGDQL